VSVAALEEVAARGWPAPHAQWLGRWLMRAGDGWTRRANSTLVLGDPGLPHHEALAHVTRWYAAHGLPPAFSLPLPGQEHLDERLQRLGWRLELDTHVLVTDVSPATASTERAADLLPSVADGGVRLTDRPPPGWDAVYRGPAPLPPSAYGILTGPPVVTFAAVGDGGQVVATGRGVVTDGWLGVTAVEVEPSHRGRGLARAVTGALLGWGGGRGATRCYLQVASTNAAALALYLSMGFVHHHVYRQRVP
jgi:N-acetylglutamate synthase